MEGRIDFVHDRICFRSPSLGQVMGSGAAGLERDQQVCRHQSKEAVAQVLRDSPFTCRCEHSSLVSQHWPIRSSISDRFIDGCSRPPCARLQATRSARSISVFHVPDSRGRIWECQSLLKSTIRQPGGRCLPNDTHDCTFGRFEVVDTFSRICESRQAHHRQGKTTRVKARAWPEPSSILLSAVCSPAKLHSDAERFARYGLAVQLCVSRKRCSKGRGDEKAARSPAALLSITGSGKYELPNLRASEIRVPGLARCITDLKTPLIARSQPHPGIRYGYARFPNRHRRQHSWHGINTFAIGLNTSSFLPHSPRGR